MGINMRCVLVFCVASLVGLSTAGVPLYGGATYSGQQQMPVRYYMPSSMNSGNQHMYVPGHQHMYVPGHQQMYVPGHQQMYVPGHQHMYVPGHQQMYVPQYYQQPYPVRQTPGYQVKPVMVVPDQVEDVPIINVDMDFSPTFTYPGAVHGGDKQTSFDSRSGSVSSTDSCKAEKLKTVSAIKANLKTLTNLHKANLTSTEIEKIFGDEFQSRSGSSCDFFKGIKCAASIGFAVPGCVVGITAPPALIACVGGIVGATNDCLSCVCFLANKVIDFPGC